MAASITFLSTTYKKWAATAVVATASLGALVVAPQVSRADPPGALAELLARSPGARVAGVALKNKKRRVAVAPVASKAMPVSKSSPAEGPVATVMSAPSNPAPLTLPPTLASDAAVPGGVAEAPIVTAGLLPPRGGIPFAGIPIVAGGGGLAGGGGAIPGGGSAVTPTPGATPTPTPPVTDVPTVPGAVPEPSAWALMILGFGMTGASLRQRRRVAIA